MKKILIIISAMFFFSCNNEHTTGRFTVTGEIKNAPDQKIFLEVLHFNPQSPPQIIDTGNLINGKISFKNTATEQGLYRLRLEKGGAYIFINDKDEISFTINASEKDFKAQSFNSPANASLKNLVTILDSLQTKAQSASDGITALKQSQASDSLITASQKNLSQIAGEYNSFLLHYVDTTTSPVVGMFALGYTQQADPVEISQAVNNLEKRFPNNHSLGELAINFNKAMAQNNKQPAKPSEGAIAPDITLPDVNDKPFSLSSLRGKYVLVDFWASWCGPCREENPNVVAAYKKYNNKNFTVLGVSLDKEKSAWLKAIKDDGLTWTHISDLKFWNSDAVALYGFDGIPYNVLVDPQGKIIATELRGDDLENKLAQVLK